MEDKIARFNKILASTGRKGIQNLINFLTVEGFYKAPASTQYHNNHEGGLLDHSLNVEFIMWKTYQALEMDIPFDSVIIAGLGHDIGKLGQFQKPYYIENYLKNGEISTAKPFVTNSSLLYVPHEVRSLQIVSQFIELTELEQHSILYHNTHYGDLKTSYNGHETSLSMLLSFADLYCAKDLEINKE
jgi:23S rRNA maturation-related 3'-5' exoribonuclease YhaM